MIDLAFYGRRIVNLHRRTKSEQSVIDAWREYHDHLNTKADETTIQLWYVQGDELFTNLLFSMAIDVGYKFDRVQLKKGAYSPIAHGELEEQQQTIRRLAIGILSGELPLKMDVTSLPMDEEIMKSQAQISSKLAAAFSDEGALIVDIKKASINKSDL
ncbi:hypothetical protein PSJM300_07445 [Stutzerimonas stutzeri DSM 10701]|nr:hypothetical protein PSJM300_07445 [Stutzerimonas stutzeri DSM 10701]